MAPSGFRYKLEKGWEGGGGVEPPIKVLQTFALPLGDRASGVSILPERNPGITLFQQKVMSVAVGLTPRSTISRSTDAVSVPKNAGRRSRYKTIPPSCGSPL